MGNQSQRVIHLAFWMYKLHQITQHKKSLKHLRNSFGLQDLKSSDTCYGVTWTPFAVESHSTPCAHCLDRKITQRIQNSANLPSCVVILDVWSWNILNMSAMASIDIRAISCVENVGSTRLCQSCLVQHATKVSQTAPHFCSGDRGVQTLGLGGSLTPVAYKNIEKPSGNPSHVFSYPSTGNRMYRIRIMKRNICEFACNPTTMKSGNQLNKLIT